MDDTQRRFLERVEAGTEILAKALQELHQASVEWAESDTRRYGISLPIEEQSAKICQDALKKVLWEIKAEKWPGLEVDMDKWVTGVVRCLPDAVQVFEDHAGVNYEKTLLAQQVELAKRLVHRRAPTRRRGNTVALRAHLWDQEVIGKYRFGGWSSSSHENAAVEALATVARYAAGESILWRASSILAHIHRHKEPGLVSYFADGIQAVRVYKNGRLDVLFDTEEIAEKVLSILTETT